MQACKPLNSDAVIIFPMNPTLHFSPITPDNYQAAFALQVSCHRHHWSEPVFADCLTDIYFAEQAFEQNEAQGEVCGYFIGLLVAGEATLMDIGLATEKRGRGWGLALLERFLLCCRERRAGCVWLEVRASNQTAINLYQRAGFELIETRKNYYPLGEGREDALVMRLVL